MKSRIIEIIKSVALGVGLVLVLQFTGLMGTVSGITQSAMLKTGLLDAGDEPLRKPEAFNFAFSIKSPVTEERLNFEQYKGKVVFLNVWATWCGPCRAEMPTIERLYQKMKDTDVVFVMLSVDRDADKQKINNYVSKHQYTFPVFQPSGLLTDQLDVPSIPTTFIIDKNGNIVSKETGASNFDTQRFIKFLNKLRAEQAVPAG